MVRPAHLPSLDGLRGLAILLVISHNVQMLDATNMHGAVMAADYLLNIGWVGVQLFFVLSGFLITGILLDAIGQPKGLRHFIARRALRIFPLYYGTLFLIFVLLPALNAQPALYQAEAPYQGWLWLYLSNWTGAMGIGPGALPHFWSLAVEEQFYLVWPVLVYALRSAPKVACACVVISILSLVSRLWLLNVGASTQVVYEWTICRIDALALGSLAAACWRNPKWAAWVDERRQQLAFGCLALFLGGFVWTHGFSRTSLRGMTVGYTVLAMVFAMVIYAAAKRDGEAQNVPRSERALWQRFLQNEALQKVGKYSYGMYVVHKPLHDLFSADVLSMLGLQTSAHIAIACLHVIGIMLVTFAIAWLSYNLYEVHFLRLKRYFA